MYLEQFKDKDVVVICNEELDFHPNKYENVASTMTYKLIELAKFLGAIRIRVGGYTKGMYVIGCNSDDGVDDYNTKINVSWCDLNKCLFLDEIWYEREKVGFFENEGRVLHPNEILSKETISFDIKLSNYDFTSNN